MNINIDGSSATNFIAILALVVSLIGIVVEMCAFRYSRPRIRIERHGRKEFAGFYRNPWNDIESEWIILLPLRIKNISNSYVSINALKACIRDIQCSFLAKLTLNEIRFPKSKCFYTYINVTQVLQLPHTMTPMQTLQYNFVFPYADEVYKLYLLNDKRPIRIKLRIEMTHGIKTLKIKIGKIDAEKIDAIDFSKRADKDCSWKRV